VEFPVPVVKLSQTVAASVGPGAYWEKDSPKGLGLIVRESGRKSWVVQKSGKKRWTLGQYPEMTAAEARKRARELLLARHSDGPRPPTLEEAMQRHLSRMERRGHTSGPLLEGELRRHLGDWLSKPLPELTRGMCSARHERLTTNGKAVADRVMRHLSAVWNTALKSVDLPTNPTIAVEPHGNQPRDYPRIILPDWHKAVAALDSPTVRAWFLVALSTGMRKGDICSLRWQDVEEDSIWRPNPKGGPTRAFRIPASAQTMGIIRALPQTSEWVFPSVRGDGPMTPPRKGGLPNAHHHRHEYMTIAAEIGIPTYQRKLLVNHSVPKADITDGYVADPNVEFCRPWQDRISDIVFAAENGYTD